MPYGLEPKDIIIFVAGAVVALFVAWLFYKKSLQRKTLSYIARKRLLIYRSSSHLTGLKDGLKITFDGRDVARLTRLTLYVWNSGNQPIIKDDLQTTVPLSIEVSNRFSVLQTSISTQTREANNVHMQNEFVRLDYLNPGDGFVIDLFANEVDLSDELDDSFTRSKPILLKGEIIGATDNIKNVPYVKDSNRIPYQIYILFVFLVLVIIACASFVDFRFPPTFDRVATIFGTIVFVMTSFVLVFRGTLGLALPKIPKNLLLPDDDVEVLLSYDDR
jgi:hypothetical protein